MQLGLGVFSGVSLSAYPIGQLSWFSVPGRLIIVSCFNALCCLVFGCDIGGIAQTPAIVDSTGIWVRLRIANFRSRLFQTYVLPAIVYVADFRDSGLLVRLDRKLRQCGRRLLHWTSGAPNAAGCLTCLRCSVCNLFSECFRMPSYF